jgi:hypothetical protein
MRSWHILLAGAGALVGCGIFLALQDLGTATDWASIGSFFLALITGIGAALSFARSKPEEASPAEERGRGTVFNVGNQIVVSGDHSHVTATFGEPPSKAGTRRKNKPRASR